MQASAFFHSLATKAACFSILGAKETRDALTVTLLVELAAMLKADVLPMHILGHKAF